MESKTKKQFNLILVCMVLFLLSVWISTAYGARIAGEKGVTPVSSGTEPKDKGPASMKPSSETPTPMIPSRSEKGNQEKSDNQDQKESAGKSKSETRYITIDFNDVDIQVFIKFISEMTGRNFIIDNAVKGKVTIISPTKITIDEAYKVFESVLEVHGFTTIPAGSVIKVVPAVDARTKDIETRLRKEAIRPEDKIVTQLISLKYANPDDLKKLFAPFISKSSVIVSYPPTGMLIVTDVLSNIKRLLDIIEALDVAGIGEEITVLPLEHATATVMAKSLSTVFQQTSSKSGKQANTGGSVVKIVPDERTNVLIILASEDDTFRIKQLVKLLDKETPRGEGDVHVYYLQNAKAEDLATVLTSIPKEKSAETEKGKAPVISEDIKIVADQSTNSLIITAKKADYLVLEDVIRKLDITRRMVYIEALIMEVTISEEMELGVEWFGGDSVGQVNDNEVGAFVGSTPGADIFPSVDTDTGSINLQTGLTLGVLGETITIGGVEFSSLGAAIKALRTDSDVHIVATPQLMTMDNEEAEIVVADNIPYLTKQETTSSSIDYSSYEFKDVGFTLNITPQINQDRFVRLKIYQEVSQVVDQEEVGLPTTLKRVAKTTISIKDGQTIVIGGLIAEVDNLVNYKVPLLGDIPILGWLFRSTSQSRDKKNLYIFITPHIVENNEEAKEIFEEKKEYMDRLEEGAVKLYQGKSREPEDVRLADLGYMRLKVQDYDKAMVYFEKALKINPDNPYAILNMGVIYQKTGDKEKATEMYNRLISLDPDARAINSTDPTLEGKKLTDIARKNLELIQGRTE